MKNPGPYTAADGASGQQTDGLPRDGEIILVCQSAQSLVEQLLGDGLKQEVTDDASKAQRKITEASTDTKRFSQSPTVLGGLPAAAGISWPASFLWLGSAFSKLGPLLPCVCERWRSYLQPEMRRELRTRQVYVKKQKL